MGKILKLILISIFFLVGNSSYSSEFLTVHLGQDYLITTEKTVGIASVAHPEILSLAPFFTIFNEKNVILLHPRKVGRTSFTIFSGNKGTTFDVTVKPKAAVPFANLIKGDFEIMLLDEPPVIEELDIDAPPSNIKEEMP